ncbi:Sua5/YciO/YrdC/YwlC family protein [Enterobacteriaceae endosymbiont of Plateumaris braccata]|uniref:Sua5/YciO/YrdC/YwlC family protein n=1 Tax=Enterobacteriaceae endosymbiont of Plateumaris braccata TaxID=2675793 RepID=UPI00144914F1|nr:Sua5/YciO/YrdC/YwlC family protein [Enterobacteriaceae endosymbiont of Plateumaris braccata]QJC28210.1 L-threonylcarbamoyladenylate synthase type 1 TsaC [Enterobacteriaceae endosymbiont of Plateumaris braccata]
MNFNIFIDALKLGKIIAYPTESSFGLGCDPDNKNAVYKLLSIKKRNINKGFILIASSYKQILSYIDETKLSLKQINMILSCQKFITWTIPISLNTPYWLTGNFNSIAIRITNYYPINQLCHFYGKPIISTSANITGCKPCLYSHEINSHFKKKILILNGFVGRYKKPSEIRDSITNTIIRKG